MDMESMDRPHDSPQYLSTIVMDDGSEKDSSNCVPVIRMLDLISFSFELKHPHPPVTGNSAAKSESKTVFQSKSD